MHSGRVFSGETQSAEGHTQSKINTQRDDEWMFSLLLLPFTLQKIIAFLTSFTCGTFLFSISIISQLIIIHCSTVRLRLQLPKK